VERTKELMLEAAVRLLRKSVHDDSDAGLAFVVSNIRVTDVVAEATRMAAEELGGHPDDYHPFTIGALYQIWPTQPDFQAALLLHVTELRSVVHPTAETTQAHIADGIRGTELRDMTMREAWQHNRADPLARVLLAAYPRIANGQIRLAMATSYESFFAEVSGAWRLILSECGRRPRPPFDESHVARSVAALIEGFSLQWLSDPDALADPRGEPDWDLPLRAVTSLVDSLTELVEHP
jgi:hypothetical protein